jgi:hypothetical protein
MLNEQMELGIIKTRMFPSQLRRQRKSERARWWFDRMRRAVDRAIDWETRPERPAEQIWFPE